MEFYEKINTSAFDENKIKDLISIPTLTQFCNSVDSVISVDGNKGVIYCLWGQFDVRQELIKHGVRFSLVNCPHALAWTITQHPTSRHIIIHCTIDKTETDEDFIESIQQFVSDWKDGLSALSK